MTTRPLTEEAATGHRPPRDRRRVPRRPVPAGPDPARWAAVLVRVSAEVAAGTRPFSQLEPLLAPVLAHRLLATVRRGRGRRRPPPITVRRSIAAPPTPSGAVEATVLVERDGRVTAVAVRLERHRGAWRATELTAPESGYRALITASDPDPTRRPPDAFDEAEAEAAGLTPPRGSA